MNEQSITGEFYRVGRVADGLGVEEGRVRAWIKAGKLPLRAHWIAGADLAAFLRANPMAVDPARMTAEQRRWAQALIGESGDRTAQKRKVTA